MELPAGYRTSGSGTFNTGRHSNRKSIISDGPDSMDNSSSYSNNIISGDGVKSFIDAFNGMNDKARDTILQNILQPKNTDAEKVKVENIDVGRLLKFIAIQASKKAQGQVATNSFRAAQAADAVSRLQTTSDSRLSSTISKNTISETGSQHDGGEVFDDDIDYQELGVDGNNDPKVDIYDVMERGNFVQKGEKRDRSREKNPEPFSSWSSSEEALMKCEGLLAFQQFNGSKRCTANDSSSFSEIIYEETINETGFYYFIFANENEITPNFMRVRFDLHKTVFDVNSATENCTDTMKCMLPLKFWSEDHVVLEVPEHQPDLNTHKSMDSYKGNQTRSSSDPCEEDSLIKGYSSHVDCHRLIVAESVCTPRKPLYMLFVLLIPILVLCFAYI